MSELVEGLFPLVFLFAIFSVSNLSTKSLVFKLQVMTHLVGHEINLASRDQHLNRKEMEQTWVKNVKRVHYI